jgi:phage-related tail fiber protein
LAAAQAAPAAGASPQTVREHFAACGYAVQGAPVTRGTAYLAVRDPTPLVSDDYRVSMIIVYTSQAAADAAHTHAHTAAQAETSVRWPYSVDNGPQLLPGYGGSVWRNNLAIVQSSLRQLNSMVTEDTETGESRVARPELQQLGFQSTLERYAVDRDLVDCLTDAAGAGDPLLPPALQAPGQPV